MSIGIPKKINFDVTLYSEIKSFIESPLFKIPSNNKMVYTPRRANSFAGQGEMMVEGLIKATPGFYKMFNSIYPVPFQSNTAHKYFDPMHELAIVDVPVGKPKDLKDMKYYEVNRKFYNLVSPQYIRSKAPRITTKGSTFHGMKKDLKYNILKELSKYGYKMVDCDMSACHSRVAASLLLKENSQIRSSLEDDNFWGRQVKIFGPFYNEYGVMIPDAIIKKILKVMLYTSLNGGNPGSEARLIDNLSKNASEYLAQMELKDPHLLINSKIFDASTKVAGKFNLANEIKELNKTCVVPSMTRKIYFTHTIDRAVPYESESIHYGISRVLQGFEVVLLSILTQLSLKNNALPISLDHDGILLLVPEEIDADELINTLNKDFVPWSEYLLDLSIPLEIKLLISKGEVI